MSYSLIIPIYNEILTLPNLIDEVNKLEKNIQIIIVDDGSDDGSNKFLKKYINKIQIVKNKSNKGKGFSIRKGVLYAKNQHIILIDGDLEIKISSIPKLIKEYEKNKNCTLIGKRWDKKDSLKFELNRIGNFFINSLFNYLYNSNLSDVLCCVRIIKTDLIKSLNLESKKFSIEIETLAKLVSNSENIIESKVEYQRRTAQQGKKLKMTDAWRIILVMIKNKFF